MSETTKQRTDRLMSMSRAELVMHAQDLTRQRDELLEALGETASYINQTYSDLIGSISAEWLAAKYADDLLPKIKSAIASVKKN